MLCCLHHSSPRAIPTNPTLTGGAQVPGMLTWVLGRMGWLLWYRGLGRVGTNPVPEGRNVSLNICTGLIVS